MASNCFPFLPFLRHLYAHQLINYPRRWMCVLVIVLPQRCPSSVFFVNHIMKLSQFYATSVFIQFLLFLIVSGPTQYFCTYTNDIPAFNCACSWIIARRLIRLLPPRLNVEISLVYVQKYWVGPLTMRNNKN